MTVRPLTYAEVGATRGALPTGYAHVRERTYLGDDVAARAGELVLTWAMHRAAGLRVRPEPTPRAAVGVEVVVVLGVGRFGIPAPCRVVWTVDEPGRIGFAYGTLPGHPEQGEELFLVEQDADGRTWLQVSSFSRPVAWYARLGGPVTRRLQQVVARRLGRRLRRLCAAQ